MALILADTDVLIDFLAGFQPVMGQIAEYAQAGRLQTSAVTCFELLSGAGEGKRGEALRQFLSVLEVLPLDRQAAEQAARVRRELNSIGQPIGMGDSLIAGIALAHGLPLFTRNRKHFSRVPGLSLIATPESL